MIHHIPTPSTAAAMALLHRYRAQQIADGKIVGEQLCQLYGTTHSRAILDEMDRRGLRHKAVPDFWIGAVLRDRRFVNTGRVVKPPIPVGSAIHDAHLIWLWRLTSSGVAPLILYEYTEYREQRPTPTTTQKVAFILRHVTMVQTEEGMWYAATRWLDDEHLQTLRHDPTPYHNWIQLFINLQQMRVKNQAKARVEAKRLVTAFVEKE